MVVSLRRDKIGKQLGWRLGGTATAAVVIGLAGFAVLGWRGSDRWLRPATPAAAWQDLQADGLALERVSFSARDGTPLAGWFVAKGPSAHGSIVLLHGLRSESSSMLEHAVYLHRAGYNVLLFDFRAGGASGGDDVTFGAREQLDALGALDYLEARDDIDMRRVGFQGVSMGAVVALLVAAADRRVAAVVAEAPFSDFPAVIERSYAHLPPPLRRARTAATVWMLNRRLRIDLDDVSAVRAARRLTGRSLLVIDDEMDANVPDGSAEAVYAAAREPRQRWLVVGAAHGAGHQRAPQEYERRVLEFWDAALRASRV